MSSADLDVLINAKLNAIVFVIDYLQIQFTVGTATFARFPDVISSGANYGFGERDYRNALCEFIGATVSAVEWTENESFRLHFPVGEIRTSLLPEHYTSPEMVVVDLADRTIVF